jgi:hypothetical protein
MRHFNFQPTREEVVGDLFPQRKMEQRIFQK